MKTYSELILLPTFKDRFDYLKLDGIVSEETFGFDRYLNQIFYNSKEWKRIRRDVILRDFGCDLAHKDYEIYGKIYIHHMNPITQTDIVFRNDSIIDPEFLVCVSHNTHNAIHYGDYSLISQEVIERRPGDTCPWKHV